MDNYTVQQLDDMCGRLKGLIEQIARPGFGTREDQVVSEVVQVIQRIGESIAWAYGQHHKPGLGEHFAQPFVDHRIRERLKALLMEKRSMRREMQNRIAGQVLQTIHILLQATPADSMLFCNLTAGWYLNEVVSAKIDFLDNEDLLPLWMTVVKDIATMLDRDNMMLFFDPSSANPFPIFTEACRYYHHPVSQVRTHVQATSLEIFLKLRDKNFWTEPLFQLVLNESSIFFTHVCCLLRDFWQMADEAVKTQERRNVRSALYIQNDILMYVNDVFMCEIPQLSDILQEKLLRFAVLPVLVRSILRPRDAGHGAREQQQDFLTSPTAWYLLHDMLVTLHSSPVFQAVSFVLLRPQVPDEVLKLVSTPPPRTPTQYFKTQADWGGTIRPAPDFTANDTTDEELYKMPPVQLITLLESRNPRNLVHNKLLEALVERLQGLSRSEAGGALESQLDTATLLLRTLRSTSEVLDGDVAERLGCCFCEVLAQCRQLQWVALEAALFALRELNMVVNTPPGRSKRLLGPPLRDKVLVPLASELLHASRQPGSDVWIQEFTEQWNAQQAALAEPSASTRQRDFLDATAGPEAPGAPTGRARCVRVLLGAWYLDSCLAGGGAAERRFERMPGFSDADAEEALRFQPGVSVHIGKMNRVKCQVRGARRGAEQEALYLLPALASLVLVRPDEQKPFWALPVIAEPLLHVRILASTDKAGPLEQIVPPGANGDEMQRILWLEISAPRSPFVRAPAFADGMGGGAGPGAPDGPMSPLKDRMSASVPSGGPAQGMGHVDQVDRISMSLLPPQPGGHPPMVDPAGNRDGQGSSSSQLVLLFADERRRRLACKILVQARHHVCQRMVEGLEAFLKNIKSGQL